MRGTIASCVRAYIFRLEQEALFTTQELLVFGNRIAIDQCLWRLRIAGYIKKIGNGVHLKCDRYGNFRNVSTEEALKKRASVGGRKVVVHTSTSGVQFLTNGRSSTILINGEKIKLKKACNRKLNLGESKAGSLLRQFWFEGKIQSESIWEDSEKISRFQILQASDRDELHEAAPLIPDWLNTVVNKKHFGRFLNKEVRQERLKAIEKYRAKKTKDSRKTQNSKRLQPLHHD